MEAQDPVSFARIANYFRNVALWLAPPTKRACMFQRATWGSIFIYPLIEELHPRLPIWRAGQLARDAIGRRASQCTLTDWIDIIFPIEIRDIFKRRPDPCLTCPPFELLEIFTLGGIVLEMLPLAAEAELKEGRIDERSLAKAMAKGVERGLGSLLEMHEKSLSETRTSMKKLAGAMRDLPCEEKFIVKENNKAGKTRPKAKAGVKKRKA